jgi:hypothetical protein
MDTEADRIARGQIQPDENLLWAGRGRAGRLALRGIPAALMGIPVTAFALFWIYMAAGQRIPDVRSGKIEDYFWLWGVLFVGFGVKMLLEPLWFALRAGRTVYAVTNRRAMVIDGRRVKTFGPRELERIERTEAADGSGDMVFVQTEEPRSRHRGMNVQVKDGFYGIENVRSVEQLLLQLTQDASKTG